MRLKSKDIAKALGLSTATVSLAINGKPGINEETRNKVLKYIGTKEREEYGLLPVQKSTKHGSIVILHYYKHGIILDRAKGISSTFGADMETTVEKAGYKLLVSHYYEKRDNLEGLIKEWEKGQIQGLYIMGAEMNKSDIYPFMRLGVPVVTGDNNFMEEGIDSFMVDNREGINHAVDYLVDKGHSNIVYLAENISIFNFTERREAFISEMNNRDCGNANNRILYLGKTIEEVYLTINKYLDSEKRLPTAFVLESSIISLGVTKALIERGFRIPKDISLIGFDALPSESLLGFELTLIKGTHTRRHIAAIKHLIRHIEEDEVEIIRIYYKTRLLEGNSVFDKAKYIYNSQRGI